TKLPCPTSVRRNAPSETRHICTEELISEATSVWLSGEKARPLIQLTLSDSVRTTTPSDARRSLMVLSMPPVAIHLPSGETARQFRACSPPPCPQSRRGTLCPRAPPPAPSRQRAAISPATPPRNGIVSPLRRFVLMPFLPS